MKARMIFTRVYQTGENLFAQAYATVDIDLPKRAEECVKDCKMDFLGLEFLPDEMKEGGAK